jgi:hypothetical protein
MPWRSKMNIERLCPSPGLIRISVVTRRGSTWRYPLRTLYAQPASAFGTTVVLLFVAITLLGQLIAPYSATEQIASAARKAPSLAHLFGTDRPRAPRHARHPRLCRPRQLVRGSRSVRSSA